jgi:Tfp pilus assembly protein PilE
MTAEQKQMVGAAAASLVLGILGLVLIGPLGSIPAVICGHIAKSKIKKSPATLDGDGMALAGLIMGYVQIGLMVLVLPLLAAIAIPSFLQARETAQRNACINNMRQIQSAKEQWALAERKVAGNTVDVSAVNEYIKQSTTPSCPAAGQYEYKRIGESPACSVHGSLDESVSGRY